MHALHAHARVTTHIHTHVIHTFSRVHTSMGPRTDATLGEQAVHGLHDVSHVGGVVVGVVLVAALNSAQKVDKLNLCHVGSD